MSTDSKRFTPSTTAINHITEQVMSELGQASQSYYVGHYANADSEFLQEWVTSDVYEPQSLPILRHSASSSPRNFKAPQALASAEQSSQPVQYSLSTVFLQDGILGAGIDEKPDIALCSQDCVLFYVHSNFVMQTCMNSALFSGLVGNDVIAVTETADVLNMLLHAVYFMPCVQFLPSFSVLERVVEILAASSEDLFKLCTETSSPLAMALLGQAPSSAIELYALAASHDMRDLATSSSSFLLSFDLSQLTDGLSQRMGSLYLKKLFFLHLGRREALKRLLSTLPRPCNNHSERRPQQAWMQAMATLAKDKTTVDLSPSILNLTFMIAGKAIKCGACKKQWDVRVVDMIEEWSAVKARIVNP